ncbi:MAG: hypothetical protein NC816_01225 [Candidatus Omnitrophica bacterium]|nr:hypothetical protein [Candidatus Omnitrophota bacterium]
MKFKSLLKIFSDIIDIININPVSTNIGVIINEFAGEDYLIEKINNYYENKSKTKIISLEANELESIELLINKLQLIIRDDFGEDFLVNPNNNSYTDLIISLLRHLFLLNVEKLIFVSYHFEQINKENQYLILSQFRNIREKLKVHKDLTSCHFLVFGSFSYFDQIKFCQKYGTSFTLDDLFYISYSSREEQNHILKDKAIKNSKNQNLVDLIQDITGGAIGLLFYVTEMILSKKIKDINKLMDLLIDDSEINHLLKNKFEKENKSLINLIVHIFEQKQILQKFNEDLEKIYLSGLVNVEQYKDNYIVRFDSWFLEVQTKKIISQVKKEYSNYHQLLPIRISLNNQAYSIIMEIENHLKNILISKLTHLNCDNNPLKILDCLGKIKNTDAGKSYTYYEWCEHKLYQHKNVYHVDIYESLVSQLDLTDLENIFLSNAIPSKYTKKSLREIFDISFGNKNMSYVLKRLKQIRNPVAHNQLIDFSILDELKTLRNLLSSKNK